MKKQTYFLYFSEPLSTTIIESQVVNWLEQFQKEQVVFDACFLDSVADNLKNKEAKIRKVNVKKKLHGSVFFIPVLRKKKLIGFRHLTITFYLLLILLRRAVFKGKKIVIQTRMTGNYISFKVLMALLPNVSVIIDYRGAKPEEYINGLGYKSINEVKDISIRKEYGQIIHQTKKLFDIASSIVCVSSVLKEYVMKTFSIEKSDHIIVVPGAADENIFHYDADIRTSFRRELGIEDKSVLIYSGQLRGYYHLADKIFEFANLFLENKDCVFICLTPNTDLANDYVEKLNNMTKENVIINYANQIELNNYLCAADIAIILREDIMTNRVASPTKIPEYLITGLPVITTSFIGDYSNFISSNKYGILVNLDALSEGVKSANKYLEKDKNRRELIMEDSKINFSKQSVVKRYFKLYEQQMN
jgi:glycosyltransferase involved in cell wall biosynthesis